MPSTATTSAIITPIVEEDAQEPVPLSGREIRGGYRRTITLIVFSLAAMMRNQFIEEDLKQTTTPTRVVVQRWIQGYTGHTIVMEFTTSCRQLNVE